MKKNKVKINILLLTIIVFFIVSCSAIFNRQSTSDLESQVSAMQTQNALLSTQNEPQGNDLEIPDAPENTFDTDQTTSSSASEELPTSPVPSGQPIIYDGWAITLSKEIVTDYKGFGVTFIVRNLGESDRIFRYQLAGLKISDDMGNIYQPTSDSLCEEHMYITKNLSIKSDDSQRIFSPEGYRNCHENNGLQRFSGPISIDAKQLFVHLESFGPLDDVTFVIDL